MAGESTVTQAEELRQAFFTNLLLLGFEPHSAEQKHRIRFSKNVFDLPNKKAFEVIAYFLFNRLDTVRCGEQFRSCWPIYEKAHEATFRKACVEWLAQISKDDCDAHLPRIVPSLFLSPGGDKFYALMHSFSTYVLLAVARRELGVQVKDLLLHPVLTPHNLDMGEVMVKVGQCGVVRHRVRALEQVQTVCGVQELWNSYANELVKEHRTLTKAVRERHEDVQAVLRAHQEKGFKAPVTMRRRGTTNSSASARLPEYCLDTESVKRMEQVDKTRELWQHVDNFFASKSEEREVIESIVHETSRPCLDAGELKLTVPELLLRRCEMELARRDVGNVYKGGKVNILSLLHLWNLALHLYYEKFHDGGLPDVAGAVPQLQAKVHVHNAELKGVQELGSRLAGKVLPDLKESVAKLSRQLDSQLFSDTAPKQSGIGLPLQSYTPTSADSRGGTDELTAAFMQQTLNSVRLNMQLTPGTPEAITKVVRSAVSVANHRPSPLAQGCPSGLDPVSAQRCSKATASPHFSLLPKAVHQETNAGSRHQARSADGDISHLRRPVVAGEPSSQTSSMGTSVAAANEPEPAVRRRTAGQAKSIMQSSAAREPKPKYEMQAKIVGQSHVNGHSQSAGAAKTFGKVKPTGQAKLSDESKLVAQTRIEEQTQRAEEARALGQRGRAIQTKCGGDGKLSGRHWVPEDVVTQQGPNNHTDSNDKEFIRIARAQAILEDKIVTTMLANGKTGDEDEEECPSPTQFFMSNPVLELSRDPFKSRERIWHTPPKDIHVSTAQKEAISDDESNVDILTVEGSEIPSTKARISSGGPTYGELFRAYLREGAVLNTGAGPQQVPDGKEWALGSPAAARLSLSSQRTPYGTTRLHADATAIIQTLLKDTPVLDSNRVPKITQHAASTLHETGGLSDDEQAKEEQVARPSAYLDFGRVHVQASPCNAWTDAVAVDRVPWSPDGSTVAVGSRIRAQADTDSRKTAATDLGEDTPRVPDLHLDAPQLFPTALVQLSLTPSSAESSGSEAPRMFGLNNEKEIERFLKGKESKEAAPTNGNSPEYMRKRLQALLFQAAVASRGGTSVTTSKHEVLKSYRQDYTLESENGSICDEEPSLLNDSPAFSPQ